MLYNRFRNDPKALSHGFHMRSYRNFPPRLFGLLGREENLTIPWQEIETIGTDAVLVHTQLPSAAPSKPGLWQSLRARLGL